MDPELILTPGQLRQVDVLAVSELGLPGLVLMENAGRHVAEWMLALGVSGEVVVAAGKGNNGGDGYVIARQLLTRGCQVRVVSTVSLGSLEGDARINAEVWQRLAGEPEVIDADPDGTRWPQALAGADWIVDALLGTSFAGALRPPCLPAVEAINARPAGTRVMSVDLPSGLNASTGRSEGPIVRADCTATLVARKPGFLDAAAAPFLGTVRVFDIGLPAAWVRRLTERSLPPG